MNLINAAVNCGSVRCFVFTSSIAVYGENPLPLREDMEPHPEDSYGIAKFAVELELKASRRLFDLPYVIFRPHNVYGERQNLGDKYRNVIGIFMNQILEGRKLSIFGDGHQTRAFSHIADVAPIIAQSIENPACHGEVFNVGADEAVSVGDLARAVMRAMGREMEVEHLPSRQEVQHAYASHDKLRRFFPAPPPLPLHQGLERMAEWATRAGSRKSRDFENIEIRKNLPPSWAG